MSQQHVVALDQGTTSSRAIVFNREAQVVGVAQKEFRQYYPKPGWVEQDPLEIWSSQEEVMYAALRDAEITAKDVAAIGITNQRETVVLWNKSTGKPVYNAIVWQCRRTAEMCDELREHGLEGRIYETTGLVVDAYFSGTKIAWALENVPEARRLADEGELAFGTVDSWLIWNLTGVHATDVTNAARTMLFNIRELSWDEEMLDLLDIPKSILPEVYPSSGVFGRTRESVFPGTGVAIAGVAGDQHAALFGQTCFEPGMVKNTYGTGSFMLVNTGSEAVTSKYRLLTTPGWALGDAPKAATYALEGSIFITGAAVQWLRDTLKIISDAAESEYFASQVKSAGGVYMVPAFVGLGAPHWDSYARGGILGLTAGSGRNEIIRATLESIAYQTRDVAEAVAAEDVPELSTLRVDGGASANDFLMQFQSDILGVPVERPQVAETTALGAAFLAGLEVGYWSDLEELSATWKLDRRFEPTMSADERDALYAGWRKAVRRVSGWEKDE